MNKIQKWFSMYRGDIAELLLAAAILLSAIHGEYRVAIISLYIFVVTRR